MRAWPLLALVLLLPPVQAQGDLTLADLQEPQVGNDLVVEVRVTAEEAGNATAVVFLNPPTRSFTLVVYDEGGREVYSQRGGRGIQTLPALEEGRHKFFVRGDGAFQVAMRHLDRAGGGERVTEAEGTLEGTLAFALLATRAWALHVEGAVQAELRDLSGATRNLTLPANASIPERTAHVLTLRGAPGAPYRVWLVPVGPEPAPTTTPATPTGATASETPGPGFSLLLGATLAGVVLMRRRRAA